MRTRWSAAFAVVLLASCGGAYDALSDAEAAYVIPGSEAWGRGDPCATADCGGEVVVDELAEATWLPVEEVAVVQGSVGTETMVAIRIGSEESRAWGQDIELVMGVLDEGYEVWAATHCPALEPDLVCAFIALDDEGRFAGVGYGAALYVTPPLARSAVAADAATGREFLQEFLFDTTTL